MRASWFRNLSLAHKLTVLATATSAVAMTVLCALLLFHDTLELRSRLVSDSEMLADMVGTSSRGALAFRDAAGAAETLRNLAVNDTVAAAMIILPDDQVLARYRRGEGIVEGGDVPAMAQRATRTKGTWHTFLDSRLAMSRSVRFDDELIGAVYVEIDLAELHARQTTLWTSLGLALVATVVLAGAIAWRLQRIVSAPLLRLTDITRAVRHDGDVSRRASPDADDEVGELVRSFNAMLDDIQRRDLELESHRQELEQTVAARTAELTANVERYRLLVESTHAVPWELEGTSYTFTYIAPQTMKMFGYEPQQLVGQCSMPALVHRDDRPRVLAQLEELACGDRSDVDIDYRVLTAQNSVLDVRSVITAQGQGIVGTVVFRGITVDVTRQKKLEMELRQAQKLESVGRLAAGVAHEINTPVQFVSDSVHFVRSALSDLEAVLHAYQRFKGEMAANPAAAAAIERVEQAEVDADIEYLVENVPKALDRSLEGLTRVATIVRSMKEFAHPDQKDMSPIDLNKAIESTLTIARNEYKYVADVETDLGDLPLVTCHAGDVNQAILNIIVNAAHAIEGVVANSGGRGTIRVRSRHEDDNVEITISDTGGGIPAEIRERVFDPFFTTKEVGKGTGQGLAIARAVIIEKHGGLLTFTTESGVGTTFVVRLPIEGVTRQGAAA